MGRYSKVSYEHDVVIKEITPASVVEKEFLEQLFVAKKLPEMMKRYLKDVESVGIKVAKVIDVTEDKMVQEFISGKTMIEYLRQEDVFQEKWAFTCLKLEELAALITTTGKTDFRVDTNLDNFILHQNELVLVDCFPPIYVCAFDAIKSSDFQFLKPLFIDESVQFIAYTGYFLTHLIRNEYFLHHEEENKQKLLALYESLARAHSRETEIGQLLTNRLNSALQYLKGMITKEELDFELKKYSVTRTLNKR